MDEFRRKRLLELLASPRFNGDREKLYREAGITKGRLSQLLKAGEPFKEKAADNLTDALNLQRGFFDVRGEFFEPQSTTITLPASSEFSRHAAALARLFDSIPADDHETRGKAFAMAGQAINAAIQESLSKPAPVRNPGLPE